MSQENLETYKRAREAFNRGDVEGMLAELAAEVEFHVALPMLLGGGATVYRGHEGLQEFVRELDSAFAEIQVEISDIRDMGDRLVAIGRLRGRGRESGAEVESPYGGVAEFKNGKLVRYSDYLDPKEALEAAGLSE